MNIILVLDLLSLLAISAAVAIIVKSWNYRKLYEVKFLLLGLLILMLLYYAFLSIEWAGITNVLDPYEDLLGGLIPILWAFTFYAFLQQIAKHDLKTNEREIQQLNRELEQRVIERTAQLETVNSELKEFAYIVSHDLKAPLRAVIQLATWINTDYPDKLDEKGKELLTLMVERVTRMNSLINGILEYSRIGRVDEKIEEIDLSELVNDIIGSLAPADHIKIVIEQRLPVIWGCRIRIVQLFQNLISNAIKHNDKPEGFIRLTCQEKPDQWLFAIADNGPGIEEKNYERIFKIFQTLKTQEKSESTGIGLTVVKKIVNNAGGKIWVESTVGEGSTFYFTLPRKSNTKGE